ncbi:Transcription factor [Macleaya cordata]|uniref:Transcription factor n=1 Tax=Macleaya cordata TaxID=56857 RepID=A0A200QJV2_MACCD|nr:Transcription factor [Macleaya cordata]
MGRAKLNMELIAKEKSRYTTFLKRKKGLKKKIYEFSTLCGVDACMILYAPKQGDRSIEPETWPNNLDETHRIIKRLQFLKGLDGITGVVEYAHITQNQNKPNNSNDGTTSWRDDAMHMQSHCYVKSLDHHHHLMTMDYPTDHPVMIFDNASMMAMNGFDCGNFTSGGTIGNFSYHHPMFKPHPFIYDQTVRVMGDHMEFANQGTSNSTCLQPPIVQPIMSYHPNQMAGGGSSSHQIMHPQLFDELHDFQDEPPIKYKRARFN